MMLAFIDYDLAGQIFLIALYTPSQLSMLRPVDYAKLINDSILLSVQM